MTYTTEELIEILDRELQANWKGKRILLSSSERINDPVVAKALNMERVGKVFAYREFREQIHEYQQKNRVSGIIWRNCTFQDRTVRCPEIHNQLIPVPGDKEILIQAKASLLDFWQEVTEGMNFWLVNAPGRHKPNCDRHEKITADYLHKLIQQTEWVEIDAARTEVYLGLCWGDPQEYRYQWAKPKSGCDRIIAARNEPSSIKI
ncbi:MAG: hypothetical protein Tsb0014_12000 [Pleurocapsa sp.]